MKSNAVKLPVVERVGGEHLADYGSARSRHDFNQRQLMDCLILRA